MAHAPEPLEGQVARMISSVQDATGAAGRIVRALTAAEEEAAGDSTTALVFEEGSLDTATVNAWCTAQGLPMRGALVAVAMHELKQSGVTCMSERVARTTAALRASLSVPQPSAVYQLAVDALAIIIACVELVAVPLIDGMFASMCSEDVLDVIVLDVIKASSADVCRSD
jgi:hypothetical protein